MIEPIEPCNQLSQEIKPAFKEINVLRHLRNAKINKKFGYTAAYLFQLVFVLLFHQKNWFRLLESLTSDNRVTAFIFDDSMFDRNRSKTVELLARFIDHATGAYYKGFRMLTMGWSDGHTFIPMDFAQLSSTKSQINSMAEDIDKRTVGYKRREEALLPAP